MISPFDISLFIILFLGISLILENWKQRLYLGGIALCIAWMGVLLYHRYFLSAATLLIIAIGLTVQIEFMLNRQIKYRFKNYFKGKSAQSNRLTERPIDLLNPEIKKALKVASRNKLGILIAIEKNDPLNEYCQNVKHLDAKISDELITAIFTPPGPLHDGALLIKNDRIFGAGAVLPISSSSQEITGTRHLAALGLSEQCDAEIWVVSEESGTVKRAYKGSFETVQRF